jgi:hypothetical protein
MKLVRENAKPISGDTGLRDIQRLAEENQFPPVDIGLWLAVTSMPPSTPRWKVAK